MPREEVPDEFIRTLDGVAEDVLKELHPQVEDDAGVRRLFVEALGRSLRKRGLKVAHVTIMPGDVRG